MLLVWIARRLWGWRKDPCRIFRNIARCRYLCGTGRGWRWWDCCRTRWEGWSRHHRPHTTWHRELLRLSRRRRRRRTHRTILHLLPKGDEDLCVDIRYDTTHRLRLDSCLTHKRTGEFIEIFNAEEKQEHFSLENGALIDMESIGLDHIPHYRGVPTLGNVVTNHRGEVVYHLLQIFFECGV